MAVERVLDVDIGDVLEKFREPRVVDLELQFLVKHLRHLFVQTLLRRKMVRRLGVHCVRSWELGGLREEWRRCSCADMTAVRQPRITRNIHKYHLLAWRYHREAAGCAGLC